MARTERYLLSAFEPDDLEIDWARRALRQATSFGWTDGQPRNSQQ
jgi:hypothetical protein